MTTADAYIIAAATTPYTRHPSDELTTLRVLADAASRALRAADITPKDIDGIAVSSFTLHPDKAIDLAWRLGLRPYWLMDSATGGASGVDMLQHARRAVQAGDASTVLVLAGDRMDKTAFARLVDEYNSATRDHLAPIPTGGPNAQFAMLTRRHMLRHGLSRSDYAHVVCAQREWAALNPGATYRGRLTVGDYLAEPFVAEPLTRLDCVPIVTGAEAVVVAARPNATRSVRIAAVHAAHNADEQEADGLATGLREIAPRLWSEAGRSTDDVDVVSVYDDYPAIALVQLEDLGFIAGSVGAFVESQLVSRRLPVNTSGGQLSVGQAGAAGGLHGVVEVVTQLLGIAGERQVPNATLGVVSGYGMVVYHHGACANAAVLEGVG